LSVLKIKREDGTWESIIGGGSSSFLDMPTFDLNEMGMPVLTLDGTTYYCECDTTELMAALDRSIVRIRADIDTGTRVFKGEAFFMQAMSVSDDVHQAIVRGTINDVDDFYDFRLLVREGIIYLSATPDVGGGTKSAVLYTAQALTEAQKAQARANIGAASADAQSDNVIPTPTEADYGKFLSATPNGFVWVTPVGGGDVPSAEGVEF
jgi:hypothetical protein